MLRVVDDDGGARTGRLLRPLRTMERGTKALLLLVDTDARRDDGAKACDS